MISKEQLLELAEVKFKAWQNYKFRLDYGPGDATAVLEDELAYKRYIDACKKLREAVQSLDNSVTVVRHLNDSIYKHEGVYKHLGKGDPE